MTGPDARTRGWAVRVPASSANLGPGFDSLGLAVSRYLSAVVVDRGDVRVTTRGEGEGEVSSGDDNLLWRSVVAFAEAHEVAVPDVSIEVYNAIPLERGLGSSSAAIVAGLGLGRALTGVLVGDRQLVELADRIEGHPDNVAPAVLGGFVACTRAADQSGAEPRTRLVIRRAQPAARLRLVVAVPTSRQNTVEARGVLPETLSRGEVAIQAGRAAHVAGALTGAWPADSGAVGDLLHEPPRLDVMASTGEVVRAWRALGLQAWLSGAGPSAAALVGSGEGDVAVETATAHGFDASVVDPDLAGLVVCPPDGCGVSGAAAAGDACAACPRRALC